VSRWSLLRLRVFRPAVRYCSGQSPHVWVGRPAATRHACWSIVLRPPRGCGRVGVGGGVKECPEGARVSGRRSLRPSPVGARYWRRRISSDQRVAPVALVGVVSRATPVRVSPGGWTGPGGGVGHPFAAPVVGGMVCCDGSARAGSIKWGDHAEPGSGIMTNNDPRPPRGRVAHAARARAGRQRRW